MPHYYVRYWVFGTLAGAWFLVMGTLPLLRGGTMSANVWIRLSGASLLIGFWVPMGWFGVMFGHEAYGAPIMLVVGLLFLFVGIVNSLSKP